MCIRDRYAAPPATLAAARCEPLEALCEAVYSDAPVSVARLAAQLRQADDGWAEFPAEAPAALRTMLTGAVLAPLLMELHMHHMETAPGGGVRLSGLDRAALGPLAASFRRRGMCFAGLSDGGLQLTESGRFVVQRCGAFGVALSYRPMLRDLETVLFGDVTEVFTHDSAGHEAHVDRTMNVLASGFMHQRYFTDMARVHLRGTFEDLPLGEQPAYIVDMGCGDGRLLRTLYEYIREHTARGRALEQHPLTMVGVDFNTKSLESTARRLAENGVPHAGSTGPGPGVEYYRFSACCTGRQGRALLPPPADLPPGDASCAHTGWHGHARDLPLHPRASQGPARWQ